MRINCQFFEAWGKFCNFSVQFSGQEAGKEQEKIGSLNYQGTKYPKKKKICNNVEDEGLA